MGLADDDGTRRGKLRFADRRPGDRLCAVVDERPQRRRGPQQQGEAGCRCLGCRGSQRARYLCGHGCNDEGGDSELLAGARRICRGFARRIDAASGQQCQQEGLWQGYASQRYRAQRQGPASAERQRATGDTGEEISPPQVLRCGSIPPTSRGRVTEQPRRASHESTKETAWPFPPGRKAITCLNGGSVGVGKLLEQPSANGSLAERRWMPIVDRVPMLSPTEYRRCL